ncbi:MAG: glucose-6-phosphate isomerase, archaeal [Parcubacteria group bacterium Licking1014_1]|nr:MAG: glucose-6-phosphate isomerase, archaeal [Parcubacteria group bacterium Licking1014_1]
MEIDLKNLTPDVRKLNDIKNVIYDQEWLKTADDFDLYYMYRMLQEKNGLRYDITVILPKMLGNEFVKTKGHEHSGNYGEIYIVLEGEGIYLMQKGDENKIEDAAAIKAKKGEAVIIPPGYGHVTINSSEKKLKTANWIVKEGKGNFDLFEKMQGACYYYLKSLSTGQGVWIKNKNYKSVPELRFEEPLKSVPENLDFLKSR